MPHVCSTGLRLQPSPLASADKLALETLHMLSDTASLENSELTLPTVVDSFANKLISKFVVKHRRNIQQDTAMLLVQARVDVAARSRSCAPKPFLSAAARRGVSYRRRWRRGREEKRWNGGRESKGVRRRG